MPRLRISAISYLNTAPLMWDFEHNLAGSGFEIAYTLPAQCAEDLRQGAADIGIIPAAAYATIPDLAVIPNVAIAATRAVRSILLVSEKPLDQVRTVALDTSSRTSVALLKVIFAKWLGGPREYASAAPDLPRMLANHDAALLIGDPALQVDRARYHTLDLAEEWIARTGKPFVFAFWALRVAVLEADRSAKIVGMFQRSRDHGIEPANLETIVREWTPRLNLTEAIVRAYLTTNIHYFLDAPALEGLSLYYRYAEECGALPQAPVLRFLP